ncbi:MAG TPA: hypothetical protein VGP33_10985 [Chloroflexota bacterium]|jgi:hypothetical protein|nr:hypothetical protein [Chloroflexota bacterium]
MVTFLPRINPVDVLGAEPIAQAWQEYNRSLPTGTAGRRSSPLRRVQSGIHHLVRHRLAAGVRQRPARQRVEALGELLGTDVPDRAVVLKVTVRRERRGSGFVARADVSKAFGGGETIGEAFIDCVNDLTERVRVFEAERDCLGPGPQQELGEIHRWLGLAS